MKKHLSALLALLLGVSLLFSACGGDGNSQQNDPVSETPVVPYNAAPLTGLEKDDNFVENARPVAIMINNISGSLPQRGITSADLIYEIVTEGGITRMMCVFQNVAAVPDLGSVRSARDQHVKLMLPLGAIYIHVGGSIFAHEVLDRNNYNQFCIDGQIQSGFLWKDNSRAKYEYSWFTRGDILQETLDKYKVDTIADENMAPVFNFVNYNEPDRVLKDGEATEITAPFSNYITNKFVYDAATQRYMKYEYGAPQMDINNNEQLGFDNVLLLYATMEPYGTGQLVKVIYEWGGYGYYFSNGRYEKVRWIKGNDFDPLRIVSFESGQDIDIKINPGKTYVGVISDVEHEKMGILPAASEAAQ